MRTGDERDEINVDFTSQPLNDQVLAIYHFNYYSQSMVLVFSNLFSVGIAYDRHWHFCNFLSSSITDPQVTSIIHNLCSILLRCNIITFIHPIIIVIDLFSLSLSLVIYVAHNCHLFASSLFDFHKQRSLLKKNSDSLWTFSDFFRMKS